MSTHAVSVLADRTFDAVLFDMDGTLIDSVPAIVRSWRQWSEEYGVDTPGLGEFHGMPAVQLIAQLLPPQARDGAFARIEELEIADTDDVVLLPGAAGLLASLTDVGAPTAIVTSCTTPLYAARAKATGLTAPVVVTASDVEHGKPAPDPYLLGAQRLGVDPARCLVVEDAPNGLRAAKAAGCATLAVVSTVTRDVLETGGLADVVVDSLTEVRFVVSAGSIQLVAAG